MNLISLVEGHYIDFPLDNDDISLELWDNGSRLELETIVIPKNLRGMGYGTKIMNEIIQYSDNVNKPIFLTPAVTYGGTSIGRLVKFYSRFGFKKNKDLSVSHYLVRYPNSL